MGAESGFAGPLAGLRVVDFGHWYAAPMAALQLADQGATVIRVVGPKGPELPDPQFRLLNRNKAVLSLDLESAEGQERARALAARADVVVESFRPGVMARRGLGAEALAGPNPRLVALSLPGFPSTDRERASIPGWEGVLGAACGFYQSGIRQVLGFPPAYASVPICSTFGSIHGAIAVLAALVDRERHGRGATIEVPLVNAGIAACSRSIVFQGMGLRAQGAPTPRRDALPPFLQKLAIGPDDDATARAGKIAALARLLPPNFVTHHFRTRDGRRIMLMPIKPGMAERFFALLGLRETLAREGFVLVSPWAPEPDTSRANLASSWDMSPERTKRVIELVQEVIGTRDAAAWEDAMTQAAIPFAVLRSREEWLAIEDHLASGMLTELGEGDARLVVPGRYADLSGPEGQTPLAFRDPVPVDFAAALDRLGEEAPGGGAPPRCARKRDQLAGVKVLDLCNVVAGPNAAYTLAQFGADVVRVEPPKSFNLPMHIGWTLEVNQGKRSAILDTKQPDGRQAFERLVREADVVLHNRLDDVAERLGQSPAALQAINPRVVVCQISAFGATRPSPWARRPGYDPHPNMTTGLDVMLGSEDEPRQLSEILADLGGGLGAAWAAVLGLYQRERSGFAGVGRASLARAASFYQLPWMIAQHGRSDWGEARGPLALGECGWHRAFECADGWLFAATHAERKPELARCVVGDPDASEEALERAFREKTVGHWCDVLARADVGCHPVCSADDHCGSDAVREVGNEAADERASGPLELLRFTRHPSGLPVVLASPAWVQVGPEHSFRRLAPQPRVGAHTREVLEEVGYAAAEIEALVASGAAHDFLPAMETSAGGRDAYFFVPRPERSP